MILLRNVEDARFTGNLGVLGKSWSRLVICVGGLGERRRGMSVIDLQPWETHEFPWGSAIKHRNGGWEKIFLKPEGQEIDVRRIPVILTEVGIEFYGTDRLYED